MEITHWWNFIFCIIILAMSQYLIMDSGYVAFIGHIQIVEVIFSMRVIFFNLSRVLLSLAVAPSDSIWLTRSVFIINSKGTTNSGTLHLLIPVSIWTVVSHGNALASNNPSHTELIFWVRAETFTLGTLAIPFLEQFFETVMQKGDEKFLMLNILSNKCNSDKVCPCAVPKVNPGRHTNWFTPI